MVAGGGVIGEQEMRGIVHESYVTVLAGGLQDLSMDDTSDLARGLCRKAMRKRESVRES